MAAAFPAFSIASEAIDAVIAHAREAAPAECCGVLIGLGDRIVGTARARNLSESPDRFSIDPKDHIDARRQARRRGLEVLGFYHSHTHSAARPSPTDLEEVSYIDHVHMIVGLESGEADVRLYALGEGTFKEIPLVSDRDLPGPAAR